MDSSTLISQSRRIPTGRRLPLYFNHLSPALAVVLQADPLTRQCQSELSEFKHRILLFSAFNSASYM